MNDLDLLVQSAETEFSSAATPADLENAKARFLGKAGRVTELLKLHECNVPYMYLDSVGLVTVGVGFMIPTAEAAQAYPFQVVRRPTKPETAATTAGAAHMKLTSWRWTRRRISVPSTLRSTTWGTPSPAAVNGIPQPFAWNIGSVCR